MDGYNLSFHSNDHARLGIQRWMEKKKLGIKPGQPAPVDNDQYEGDNLNEIEGDA